MIEGIQDYLDQIQQAGSGAVVVLGLVFVLVALAMAIRGLRS